MIAVTVLTSITDLNTMISDYLHIIPIKYIKYINKNIYASEYQQYW